MNMRRSRVAIPGLSSICTTVLRWTFVSASCPGSVSCCAGLRAIPGGLLAIHLLLGGTTSSLAALLFSFAPAHLLAFLLHDLAAHLFRQCIQELLEDLGLFARCRILACLGAPRAHGLRDDLLSEFFGECGQILRVDAKLRDIDLLASDRCDDPRDIGWRHRCRLSSAMRFNAFHCLRVRASCGSVGIRGTQRFSRQPLLCVALLGFFPLTLSLLLSLLGFLSLSYSPFFFLPLFSFFFTDTSPLFFLGLGFLLMLERRRNQL
ncbi:hypothetical protein HYQ46_000340 [Verticillium longisporum]|nr:hypothetical protein HYQ46_000340 [Verticillium longisporum]